MYGCSHSVISLGRWSGSVNYMLLTSSHSEPLTRKTYSMVVTYRQTDGGQMDRNVTLCGLYLCDVSRLPQYAIIPSHCPITAVHQHGTGRPHCSLLEFVNRTRYVTSRVMGINDHDNSIRYAAEWWLTMHSRPVNRTRRHLVWRDLDLGSAFPRKTPLGRRMSLRVMLRWSCNVDQNHDAPDWFLWYTTRHVWIQARRYSSINGEIWPSLTTWHMKLKI